MNVGTPPWPKRPKSSAPITGSSSLMFDEPTALPSTGTIRATRAGVLTVGGVLSWNVIRGSGAGCGAVAPLAPDHDVDRGRAGQGRARGVAELARRLVMGHVQRQGEVGPG